MTFRTGKLLQERRAVYLNTIRGLRAANYLLLMNVLYAHDVSCFGLIVVTPNADYP